MRDFGIELVNYVFEQMKIDREWSVRTDRGFTWWGKDLAQSVWAESPVDDNGALVSRVHARTDLVKNAGGDADALLEIGAANDQACMSAAVIDAADPGKVRLACSTYVHESTYPWVGPLFSLAAALQAAEAHLKAEDLAGALGAEADTSTHPSAGPRPQADDILNIPGMVIREGEVPRWLAADFDDVAKSLQQPPCVLASGGKGGLAAEFPLGEETMLLKVSTQERHPWLGGGLSVRFVLPQSFTEEVAAFTAMQLNRRELAERTRIPMIGAWSCDGSAVSFASFWPNLVYRPGLLGVLVRYMMGRARWAAEEVFGDDWRQSFEKAFRRKAEIMKRFAELMKQGRAGK